MPSPLAKSENFLLPGLSLPEADAARTEMIFVPGGLFRMGSADDEAAAYKYEKPAHDVTIPDFFIGRFPVTQALWKAVLDGDDPAFFKGDDRPVESISWNKIQQEFLPALEKMTGIVFRLPTEAEWEYAARGGPHWQDGFAFSGSDKLKEVGWFEGNSHRETKPVGLKYPNRLGLYDMSGNVWELVQDQWHSNYEGAPKDGKAWEDRNEEGVHGVIRGGSSWYDPPGCRVAYRRNNHPAVRGRLGGFRLAASFQALLADHSGPEDSGRAKNKSGAARSSRRR